MNFCPSQLEAFYHDEEKMKYGKTISKNMS